MNFFIKCLFLVVILIVQNVFSAPKITKSTKSDNLDGKFLHDDPNFKHNKTEGNWKSEQKLNISDPSSDRLEAEIKIKGHENEKVLSDIKLNVSNPSLDAIERELMVPGQEKDKPEKKNITDPSVDRLEEELRVKGHENDSIASKPLNVSEPSLNLIEEELKVKGHEFEASDSIKVKKMKPSLSGEMRNINPRFKHVKGKNEENIENIEPSNKLLEKLIEIENGTKNESPKVNRSDILPSYEGFHGVLVHGDETYQHGAENSSDVTLKPADLDDFKSWMKNQENETKLDRFKRLHDEFENMNNPMEDHDFKNKKPDLSQNSPSEKLKRVIKEIEEEEYKKKTKTDL